MLGFRPQVRPAARRQARAMSDEPTPAPLPEAQQRFVDGIAQYYYDNDGMPRGRGRVIGWMIISDPKVQSVSEICRRLDVQPEDVDWVARQLSPANVLRRHEPADTGEYALEMGDTAWVDRMQEVFSKMPAFHQILAEGSALLADAPAGRRARVDGMEKFFGYLSTEIPGVFDRYRAATRQSA